MKKTLLSLFSANLLLFSSPFIYACSNNVSQQQPQIKKDSVASKVTTRDFEIYDQSFINQQVKKEDQAVQTHANQDEDNNSKQKNPLDLEQNIKQNIDRLSNKNIDHKENEDLDDQQVIEINDQLELLSQIKWTFLKNTQIKDLIEQIEANQIYQDFIAKIDSPVEILVFDNDKVKTNHDYLQTNQYLINLKYVVQSSLYPMIKNFMFKANVIVKQISQKQINETIANKYCDLIALWNQEILHLNLDKIDFYNVKSLIEKIKTNVKTYALIDDSQIIDDANIFIANNNQLLSDKNVIANQLYNVEIEVKIGQANDQVKKWTSFIIDFTKDFVQQEEQLNLGFSDNFNTIEQDKEELNLFEEELLDSKEIDELLDLANITLDKLINLLYDKAYFKDFIIDLNNINSLKKLDFLRF